MDNIQLIRPIVSAEEWINDPFYSGDDGPRTWSFWKDHFINYFSSIHNTFIFWGSYRFGKTHNAEKFLARTIYEISCIKDFPTIFGLSPLTVIKIAYIQTTLLKAEDKGISSLIKYIDTIPYFQEVCPRNRNIDSVLSFPFLEVFSASNLSHLTSEDLYGVIFDEANFVKSKKGEEHSKAKEIFLESMIRAKATFSMGGQSWGFFGLLSSAGNETSFTETMIKSAMQKNNAYLVMAPVYKVKPWAFSKKTFQVFSGLDDIDPFIITDCTDEIKFQINKTYGITFEQFLEKHIDKIENVPIDFKEEFQTDVKFCLRAISGVFTKSSKLLLKNMIPFLKIFENNNLKNPLNAEFPTLSLLDDDIFEDFVNENILFSTSIYSLRFSN